MKPYNLLVTSGRYLNHHESIVIIYPAKQRVGTAQSQPKETAVLSDKDVQLMISYKKHTQTHNIGQLTWLRGMHVVWLYIYSTIIMHVAR